MKKWILGLALASATSLQGNQKVLCFSGSLREGSYNKKLVIEAAKQAQKQGAEVTLIDLADCPMPFYNADLEASEGQPSAATEIRELMLENDHIIIASPEYNSSITAVLKNTIDWTSRNEKGEGSLTPYKGKTFTIMSASPGRLGGSRGLIHLRSILENMGAIVTEGQVTVPTAHEAFNAQGELVDAEKCKELETLIIKALG